MQDIRSRGGRKPYTVALQSKNPRKKFETSTSRPCTDAGTPEKTK